MKNIVSAVSKKKVALAVGLAAAAVLAAPTVAMADISGFTDDTHKTIGIWKGVTDASQITADTPAAYIELDKSVDDRSAWTVGKTHTYTITLPDGYTFSKLSDQLIGKYNAHGDSEGYFTTSQMTGNTITLKSDKAGAQSISLAVNDKNNSSCWFACEGRFYVIPNAPKKVGISSTWNSAVIDPGIWDYDTSGNTMYVVFDNQGTKKYYDVKSAGSISGLKPNTKYTFTAKNYYDYDWDNYGGYCLSPASSYTFKTGPSTKPVIKSVKISNVKVKKYRRTIFSPIRYTTTWKATVTLKSKASGTKGAQIHGMGYHFASGDYTTKYGTGKTFTLSGYVDSETNYSGKTFSLSVNTLSDKTYGALSPVSKTKKYKIKNGAY